MLRKLFSSHSQVEKALYEGTSAEASERAHHILSLTVKDGRSLHEVLSVLPAIRVKSPISIRGHDIVAAHGSFLIRFGLMDPTLIQGRGFDVVVSAKSTLGYSPVLGVFHGRTPLHLEMLSNDLLDQADAAVVGWDMVSSRPRKYLIELEPRVRAILKLLE